MKRLARKILIFNAIIAAATLGVAWYAGVRETYYLAWILAGVGGAVLIAAAAMAQTQGHIPAPLHTPGGQAAMQINYLMAVTERDDDRRLRMGVAAHVFSVAALLLVEAAFIGLAIPRFS